MDYNIQLSGQSNVSSISILSISHRNLIPRGQSSKAIAKLSRRSISIPNDLTRNFLRPNPAIINIINVMRIPKETCKNRRPRCCLVSPFPLIRVMRDCARWTWITFRNVGSRFASYLLRIPISRALITRRLRVIMGNR